MSTQNIEAAKMIIRFYNVQASASVNDRGEARQNDVISALDRLGGDIQKLKNHIKEWIATTDGTRDKNDFDACLNAVYLKDVAPAPAKVVAPTEAQTSNALGVLEQALIEVIKKQSIPTIEADIKGECTRMLQDFIKNEYGTIERKITTVVDGKKVDMKGIVHERFDLITKFVANDEPVFLTGPAGSGKNHLCKQVADALGLKFYFTNAVTQEYKLTGFTDANGHYQPTQFYEAFKNGGLFMLDEMDASIPEVLVILNAAIANRYFDFPAPIGYVEAHPDFRVIAAGNTTGNGADYEYVGRNQLDAASLDRFAVVRIDYDFRIENGLAGDIEIADFCRDFREASRKCGIQMIVSYRAIGRLAKMMKIMELTDALSTCLVKGLEKDDINTICHELPERDAKYKEALRKLAA